MTAMKQNKKLHGFTVKEILPQGWLKRQLRIQMAGLTGCLYEIWDSVGSYSGWLGGTGDDWERAPYYLDGLVPLAYYLEDEEHWNLVMRFIEWTIGSQDPFGNFGPQNSKDDYWSRYVMLKVLIQYYEITEDGRVLTLFQKYFSYLKDALEKRPMTGWARARAGDLLYCVIWYYEKAPSSALFELTALVKDQALDWVNLFEEFPYVRPVAYYYDWENISSHYTCDQYDEVMNYHANHIVNVTMGFKYPAMLAALYDDKDYKEAGDKGMQAAERYHGVVSGAVNGDEHLSGNDPSQGAELCSIVEYMFSLQTMLEVFGDPVYGDRLERLAYNALPATISEDFMAHQYLQQANQALVSKAKRNWFNNNEESTLFGLEPNFGCCTANMHQGWPKFPKSLWYREKEDLFVSMVYAPCILDTTIGAQRVIISENTDYPFKNTVTYEIIKAEQGNFTLKLRIPGWCRNYQLIKNGDLLTDCEYVRIENGFITVSGPWKEGDLLRIIMDMDICQTHWFHDSIALERGPLVYGLDIKEQWHEIREIAGIKDYEIMPQSPWNYALEKEGSYQVHEYSVGAVPFSKETPPIRLTGKGKLLPNWKLQDNSAGPIPASPVVTDSEEETIALLPFGCTKLRISQFPYYNKS